MARRSDHSREELKALAIQSVFNLVDRNADVKVTARAVTKAMGYTVGTLYQIFDNLDALIAEVNANTLERLYSAMRAEVKLRAENKKSVLIIAEQYLLLSEQQPGRWRLLSVGIDASQSYESLNYWVESIFMLLETQLRQLAPARTPEEIAIAARALWSSVHGICAISGNTRLKQRAQFDVSVLVTSLVNTYLSGLVLDTMPLPQSADNK